MRFNLYSLVAAVLLPSLVTAQLSGSVGPLTSRESKRSKVCNVLDYGATASKTSDVGPALASAFAACATGGTGKLFEKSDGISDGLKCTSLLETSGCPHGLFWMVVRLGLFNWMALSTALGKRS